MQQTPKQTSNSQPLYFSRYLSLIPVIAVIGISLAFTLWLVINSHYPDRLFFPEY